MRAGEDTDKPGEGPWGMRAGEDTDKPGEGPLIYPGGGARGIGGPGIRCITPPLCIIMPGFCCCCCNLCSSWDMPGLCCIGCILIFPCCCCRFICIILCC